MFVFFGLVAVLGTQYTQAGWVDWVGLALAVAVGSLSSAVLVANNLRDIPTDREAEKITLAVRLGDARTRLLYQGLLAVALVDDAAVDARDAVVRGGADRGAVGVAGGTAGAHGRRRQGSHPRAARHRVDDAGVVGRGGAGVDVSA